MISNELLEILVCPQCKGELEYYRSLESLDCPLCHLRFRIEDDIPVMLIEEATSIPAHSLE